jgi:hypothetical protein
MREFTPATPNLTLLSAKAKHTPINMGRWLRMRKAEMAPLLGSLTSAGAYVGPKNKVEDFDI